MDYFLIVFLIAFSVSAQKSNARAQLISLDRSNVLFPGDRTGFDFENLKFKYQFVVCKDGKIKLGVAYDKKADFTKYRHNGKEYSKGDIGAALWPDSKDVRIKSVTGNLYYGSRNLGKVTFKKHS